MKLVAASLLIVCLATCLAPPASAQVVLIGGSTNNGNLDRTFGVEITPGFFLPKPQVWINEASRAVSGPTEEDLSSEPWAGPAPTPMTIDGNLNPPSPEGCDGPDCAVFFKSFNGNLADGVLTSHLYQEFPAARGASYLFTGWAGAEANFLANGAEIALQFLDAAHAVIPASGHVVQMLPTLAVPNGQMFNYKLYAAMAVAPAGTFSVRARVSLIQGLANPGGGSQAFVVDDLFLIGIDNIFANGFESGNTSAWSNI